MKRIVGRKKAPAPTLGQVGANLDRRVDVLDARLDKMRKDLKRIKVQLATTKSPNAKQDLRNRAKRILRQMRMMEEQRENLNAQSFAIHKQDFATKSMDVAIETVKAMEAGKKEIIKKRKKLSIDKIDDLKGDIENIMEDFNEVNELLGSSAMDDISERELDEELGELDEYDDDMTDVAESETPTYISDLHEMAGLPPAPIDTQTPANESPQSIPEI
eukprot:CAMPEP_0184031778 /NCGR_PEP_ID=MMETSP0955-20130417/2503_1 /TAXON_ID=627963 /ORGANISM="Aplanochytrium sp, Strain PBS07" /LENGTH=216 /DNA_ID=CAMNT_0026317625 /DNA_START=107 /DNA_END=757 /DNA_ORIENTATION=+